MQQGIGNVSQIINFFSVNGQCLFRALDGALGDVDLFAFDKTVGMGVSPAVFFNIVEQTAENTGVIGGSFIRIKQGLIAAFFQFKAQHFGFGELFKQAVSQIKLEHQRTDGVDVVFVAAVAAAVFLRHQAFNGFGSRRLVIGGERGYAVAENDMFPVFVPVINVVCANGPVGNAVAAQYFHRREQRKQNGFEFFRLILEAVGSGAVDNPSAERRFVNKRHVARIFNRIADDAVFNQFHDRLVVD